MGDFEKDLQNAFEGAEFAPSPKVWEGVKAGIAPKKKVGVFYMWQTYGVAAAIIFLFTMGFLFRDDLFGTQESIGAAKELASENSEAGGETNGDNDDKPVEQNKALIPGNKSLDEGNTNSEKIIEPNSSSQYTDLKAQTDLDKTDDLHDETEMISGRLINVTATNLAAQNEPNEVLASDVVLVDQSILATNQTNIYVLGPQDWKESIAELRLRWELKNMVGPLLIDTLILQEPGAADIVAARTSLNGSLGSGSFNPNGSVLGASSAENLAVNDPQVGQFSLASGEERQLGSLSVGAGIGIELSKRWLLKLGLRYNQYRYANTSNAYALEDGNALPLNSNLDISTADLRFAGEYEITNTIHSVSIPVQFGYKVLDRNRFDLTVKAGVGLDYFVSYIIEGDLNFLGTRSVDLGETNYLNKFNVNVLTGLELGYELNDKFGLSAEFFFRQYLPSLNPSENEVQATPSFLGFGLGVNYFLRKKK